MYSRVALGWCDVTPRLLPAAVAVLALTAACGTHSAASSGKDDLARYVQTWGTDYDHTDCAQWTNSMTAAQRWTAAYDLLRDSRAGDTGIARLPADKLVDRFAGDISTRCAGMSESAKAIPDTAADAYQAGRATYSA